MYETLVMIVDCYHFHMDPFQPAQNCKCTWWDIVMNIFLVQMDIVCVCCSPWYTVLELRLTHTPDNSQIRSPKQVWYMLRKPLHLELFVKQLHKWIAMQNFETT